MKLPQLLAALLLVLLLPMTGMAQERVTLSGYVKDGGSGEALISAAVFLPELRIGANTNEYGFYSLSVPPGKYAILVRYVSFETHVDTLELTKNTTYSIEMVAEVTELEEVLISAEAKNQNITDVEMSTMKLSVMTVKKMPQLLGEVDIIRSVQMLPGVTTVGEGATGFNVRGGNVDQNLILLDEAPVYNSSHLFGFFSVFNADAVKDVKLYKGGIPAKYGGRLSSVMDVRQNEGNNKRFSAKGGIGLLSSRLTLEAPIVKDKSSFMVAGRRSYFDIFAGLSNDSTVSQSTLYFYDLNAKANYTFNDNNRLFISGYFGKDDFEFADLFGFSWGNSTFSARWNHLFSERLFSNFTVIYSDYQYQISILAEDDPFDINSQIENYNVKSDFGFYLNPQNTLEFGISSLLYRFQPGEVVYREENPFQNADLTVREQQALESAVYISNEQKVGTRLTLQYGLRFSVFNNIGRTESFVYAEGQPRTVENIIDTVNYGNMEIVKTYTAFEPRFSGNYVLNEAQSIKFSYNRTAQYIHLVSNTTSATPVDVWTPANEYIRPAIADQVTLGYFRNFKENTYEGSLEVYYKNFTDLIDYIDGADLIFNDALETQLLTGRGRAYGAEFLLRKQTGKLTGWLAYTLSRTERQVDGINSGEWYSANWDKTHDLSLFLSYSLSKRFEVGANFAFMTGRPITFPNAKYEIDGVTVPNYDNRNGARIPNYHRLDASVTYTPKSNERHRWQHSLNLSVYNLYNRRNPYSIFFRQNEDDPTITEAVRLSIFGSVIPSLTYNFEF